LPTAPVDRPQSPGGLDAVAPPARRMAAAGGEPPVRATVLRRRGGNAPGPFLPPRRRVATTVLSGGLEPAAAARPGPARVGGRRRCRVWLARSRAADGPGSPGGLVLNRRAGLMRWRRRLAVWPRQAVNRRSAPRCSAVAAGMPGQRAPVGFGGVEPVGCRNSPCRAWQSPTALACGSRPVRRLRTDAGGPARCPFLPPRRRATRAWPARWCGAGRRLSSRSPSGG
jgi:hypothetical protein